MRSQYVSVLCRFLTKSVLVHTASLWKFREWIQHVKICFLSHLMLGCLLWTCVSITTTSWCLQVEDILKYNHIHSLFKFLVNMQQLSFIYIEVTGTWDTFMPRKSICLNHTKVKNKCLKNRVKEKEMLKKSSTVISSCLTFSLTHTQLVSTNVKKLTPGETATDILAPMLTMRPSL